MRVRVSGKESVFWVICNMRRKEGGKDGKPRRIGSITMLPLFTLHTVTSFCIDIGCLKRIFSENRGRRVSLVVHVCPGLHFFLILV